MTGNFKYPLKQGVSKGVFNIYQSRTGAIILVMANNYIILSKEQVEQLHLPLYELELFNPDSYNEYYNAYHEYRKQNEPTIKDVIDYIEKDADIAMPICELIHDDGTHFTKKEYGKVLLKYLVKELRNHFKTGEL